MICRTLFIAITISVSASAADAQCGIERWPVKTTADSDAQYVSRAAVPATIAQLRSLQPPRPLLQANRMAPVEETIYSVTATLIAVKSEEDSDYRLVLADAEGRTIIAEIPAPAATHAATQRAWDHHARTPPPLTLPFSAYGFCVRSPVRLSWNESAPAPQFLFSGSGAALRGRASSPPASRIGRARLIPRSAN